MEEFKQKLAELGFRGELDDTEKTRDFYSHDASMFEIRPELVAYPKDGRDVERLVKAADSLKGRHHSLSLTGRSRGTDMGGGAINESVIVDFARHFSKIEKVESTYAYAQPGVMYKDFEVETLKKKALMPTYPASRDLCGLGGMVNNNAGGEKSLEFGKTQNFVSQLKFVFADGVERLVGPLNEFELKVKMNQTDFEGQVYRQLYELIERNYDEIKAAKPAVSKNSTGYNLWDVYDRDRGIFDLTKLIVGAQGTLGFVTDIHFKLVPAKAHSGVLVLFLRGIDELGDLIPRVLNSQPATFESFDDATLKLSIRFMPSFYKMLGLKKFLHLIISLIPDGLQLLRGIPKLILMVEFNGDSETEVRDKIRSLHSELRHLRARYEINGFEEDPTAGKAEKFWLMRRQSFQLLRSKVKDKHTAPFIDDLVVAPAYLTEFLPKLQKIIAKYHLLATIAGHMGDGNFHIIPLMKLEEPSERAKLLPAMKEVNELVLRYHGSLSGEHNDGLVRGPWLGEMYGPTVLKLFQETKRIMDPAGLFNPHKKANATWEYSYSHIRDHF